MIVRTPAEALAAFQLQPGDEALVVHAHPDDEAMANSQTTTLLALGGVVMHFMTATLGRESTRGDSDFVRNGKRRLEFDAALGHLGIGPEQRHIHDLPDGRLHVPEHRSSLRKEVTALLQRPNMRALFTPGEHGFDQHPDHIIVHEVALEAAASQPTISVWGIDTHSGLPAIRVPTDQAAKLQVLGNHRSQFAIHTTEPHDNPHAAGIWILTEVQSILELAPYDRLLREEPYTNFKYATVGGNYEAIQHLDA